MRTVRRMTGHQGEPGSQVAVGVRATYDAVAAAYDEQLADELSGKPLDRALLLALTELARNGVIADVGCGPGHVTRFLAEHHPEVIGIDLSPGMIAIARKREPQLGFSVGSVLGLPLPDHACTGVLALYSIIHLTAGERRAAFREFARVLRPGGWLLVSFHIDSDQFAAGEVNHLRDWFGQRVELDGYFLRPDEVAGQLESAGFTRAATVEREPTSEVEYPSRRCYLLAQRT